MEAEGDSKREEVVVQSVQRWLGNPFLRSVSKLVCGRSKHGGLRLDRALRRYVGDEIPCDFHDRIASWIVRLIVGKGSSLFGYPEESLKRHLRDPVIRRGMVNILEGIVKYGARRPFISVAPFLVVWNYTKLCNLRCKHCYERANRTRSQDELTTEECKATIDQLEDAGVVAIAFSGGEPLLREDLFEVAGYAKKKGFFVSIATNGTLITKDVARRVKNIFDYAEISLDGFERTHDEFRGVRGAWKRTCAGIRNAVKAGIETCVALTSTRSNLREIPKLVEFVEKELGVKRVMIFNFVPVGAGKEIVHEDISPHERYRLLEFLFERMLNTNFGLICYSTAPQFATISWKLTHQTGDGGVVATHFTSEGMAAALRGKTESLAEFLGGCGTGRLYCGLQPNGDIVPCVFMPIKLGNIREDSLTEIWGSSEILQKLRDRESLKGCGSCEYRYICGGCRARAYAYFGDTQGPDPGCLRNLHYWEELKNKGRLD